MQQNVTTGLGGDLCGLLAKQTDEGNLSCGSCFAEQGGLPHPLLLASPVTCHATVGTRRGETRGVDGRRGGGAEDGDVKAERGEMMCRGERQMRMILSVKCQTFTAADDPQI